jgi:hypothetical protein
LGLDSENRDEMQENGHEPMITWEMHEAGDRGVGFVTIY